MPWNAAPTEAGAPEGDRVLIDAEKLEELRRLRDENRRLAVSLGAFSAFVASRGLLEEAWSYVHQVHQMEDGALS